MPQAPSPNMNIIWPVDKNDADAWDALMDTAVRVVIDGHTHAPGDGAQILLSSLKVDQDISWASGGIKFGISDLKAIDFFPVAASTVAALAGAFFLSDGSGGLTANELYYRTTAGANVKVTNGAALNISAFSGGIGGDYTAVGALVEFNDASDAYWFEQQVGASVRQYAKMRCSDLALFEFKAVGVSPVPSFAVTLKSPAALAANYSITFPGAPPAGNELLVIDSTGAITAPTTATLATNSSIVLSGTGTYKHGTKSINVVLKETDVYMTTGSMNSSPAPGSVGLPVLSPNDVGYVKFPSTPTHWRIVNVTVAFTIAGDRANTTLTLAQSSSADPAVTTFADIGSTTLTNTGTAKKQVTGVNLSPGTGQGFFLKFAIAAGGVTGRLVNMIIDYDVP